MLVVFLDFDGVINYRGVPRVPEAVVAELQGATLGQLLRMLAALVLEIQARQIIEPTTVVERVQKTLGVDG